MANRGKEMVQTTTSTRNGVILSVTIDEEYYKDRCSLEQIKSMRNSGVPVFYYRVRWEDCSEGALISKGQFPSVAVGDSVVVDVTDGSMGRHYGWPEKV
jgi:hypothetical protein